MQLLKDQWFKVTGDSSVIRIDRIEDFKAGVREVLKYVTKPADVENWTADNMADYVELRGMRLL